jgi:hypothetical protein
MLTGIKIFTRKLSWVGEATISGRVERTRLGLQLLFQINVGDLAERD